jgi:hypothetical protein
MDLLIGAMMKIFKVFREEMWNKIQSQKVNKLINRMMIYEVLIHNK